MDKKDERILAELIINSRISFKQLAKKAGISREVAAYRVKKLIEEQIITDFYSIINIEAIGYIRNGCCIQLKEIDSEKEKAFFSFLANHPFITYAGTIVGKWNVAFDILSRDRLHMNSIINEILKHEGQYIENYLITNNSAEQEIFQTKILGLISEKHNKKDIQKVEIDETDKKILNLLSTNSRADYVEISSKLNLTANAIKYRIKKLEKTGVIQGYTISLNVHKLGYEFYNIQIKLNPNADNEKLKNFLRAHEKVIYYYKYLGHENWDIDIGVIAKDSHDLRETIMQFRKSFGSAMKIYDIYTTLEVLKADVAPEGIFN